MILVSGATGQLGKLVIQSLLAKVPASQIVAAVRNVDKAKDLADLGVIVRRADYNDSASLDAALEGVTKALLISSSEVGSRYTQHVNFIDAAKRANIGQLVYTSLLHADTSTLALKDEHIVTEEYLAKSDIPFTILRNGWYSENYTASIPPALAHNALYGCAGDGKIASAPRADYAEAAAVVLTSDNHIGKIYELAGDDAYTLTEFAAELSKQADKQIPYVNLTEEDYKGALVQAGLPEPLAGILADSDAGAAKGQLFDDSKTLSKLIGRATVSFKDTISAAL